MSTPNRANIRKWVNALRSGEFKQATGELRVRDSYCCLGVACEVYRRDSRVGLWVDDEFTAPNISIPANHFLPELITDWLGIGINGDPQLGSHTAVSMNDEGFSFAQIADAIEREYLAEQSA